MKKQIKEETIQGVITSPPTERGELWAKVKKLKSHPDYFYSLIWDKEHIIENIVSHLDITTEEAEQIYNKNHVKIYLNFDNCLEVPEVHPSKFLYDCDIILEKQNK
jgi:hypothetical protein